jgi:hypothetical protein
MAGYSSCAPLVPQWGTYFQKPQIYIINVPQCAPLFGAHIHPQYPILSVVPIVNTVVAPLFFICFMVNNYFILYVCIHYNMYIGPSLPPLPHSFYVFIYALLFLCVREFSKQC